MDAIVGPSTLVGIGTLEFTLVRPSVRPFQEFSMTIHCIFLKFCMELYMGENVTFSDFRK